MPVSEQEVDVVVPLSISIAKRLSSVNAFAGVISRPFASPLLAADCVAGVFQPVFEVLGADVAVAAEVGVYVKVGVFVNVDEAVTVEVGPGVNVCVAVKVPVGGIGVLVRVGVKVGSAM